MDIYNNKKLNLIINKSSFENHEKLPLLYYKQRCLLQ